MTAIITVTTSNLSDRAAELQQLNQAFRVMVDNLAATEAALNSMWEGEAREAFRKVFEEDKVQLVNFANLIEKYALVLLTIADNYRKAEETNTNIALTRTH